VSLLLIYGLGEVFFVSPHVTGRPSTWTQGPNYSYITPAIVCGSCMQQPTDIDHLRDVVGALQHCV
jgi:hypothetical protein